MGTRKAPIPRSRTSTQKHTNAIRDILTSHPKAIKIRYEQSTLITLGHAWLKWERFCSTEEVIEAFGANDPTALCNNLTPAIVRAFLYWMCSQGNFTKLDSLLSHARQWRMAVRNETQCNVPEPIAQDMSLYIHSDLRGAFELDELSRIKTTMNTDDVFSILHFHWTRCNDWYPTERDRLQHEMLNLICYGTSARPGTIIEGGGYRKENNSDSLKYKDIRLHLVKDPRDSSRKRLLMLIRLRLMKGYRNRGSPPSFVFYERPDTPSFCIVTRVLALAFADQAFASRWIRAPEDIWKTDIPSFRAGIPLEWDEAWHDTPVMRRAVNVNGVVTTSKTQPAQYAPMLAWNLRLGRSYGLEHRFYFYCLRRGAGAAFNKNMSVAERMQAMGHHHPGVYDKHYLNEVIQADTLGILLGTPSNKQLMSLASHTSLTRDPHAPTKLSVEQMKEVMAHPELVELRLRRDEQKAALPQGGKRLKLAQTEDPVGYKSYCSLRKEFDSLRKTLRTQKYEQIRTDYFSTVGARYIEQQHLGNVVAELPPPPVFEVAERRFLVDLLFPQMNADGQLDQVLDWPSDTHHCRLVTTLTELCSRRCSPLRRTKQDEERVYVEPEEDDHTPSLYPIVCPSTLCLFCLGDASLPLKDREQHFSKRSNLKRHVKVQHLRFMERDMTFCCPHPACSEHHLQSAMEFFNHAEVLHNIRH